METDKLETMLFAASRGPWAVVKRGHTTFIKQEKWKDFFEVDHLARVFASDANAALIAAAPDLAAEVLRLRAENAQLLAANQALVAREAEARGALESIASDCEADYPPSHGAIKHFARAFLAGKAGS